MADDQEAQTTEVACASDADLYIEWGAGHSLEVGINGFEASAGRLDWSSLGPLERLPAHNLAALYEGLQSKKNSGSSGSHDTALRQYADRVTACISSSNAEVEVPDDEFALQLQHEAAVWELMCICFLDGPRPYGATQALTLWLKRYYGLYGAMTGTPVAVEIARLSTETRPEEDAAYWPLLQRLTALGQLEEANELLGAHSIWTISFEDQQRSEEMGALFTLVDLLGRLLRRMPQLCEYKSKPTGGLAVTNLQEFLEKRGRWQAQVRELLAKVDMWKQAAIRSSTSAEGLQQVAAMLCGSGEAIERAAGNWLELLVAQLQHLYPDLAFQSHLSALLQRCLLAKGLPSDSLTAAIAELLEAIGEEHYQGLMQTCSTQMSPWLAAHLTDLMLQNATAAHLLNHTLPHLGCSQVEHFVLEYACSLFSNPLTWHLAANYLVWCPCYGKATLARAIDQAAASADPHSAHKLLNMCSRLGLTDSFSTVCEIQAISAKRNGRLAEALEWALRAGNRSLGNSLAAALLLRIAKAVSGGDSRLLRDVVDELGELECILTIGTGQTDSEFGTSDTLAFLHAFLHFECSVTDASEINGPKAIRALTALLQNSNFKQLGGHQRLDPRLGLDLLFQAVPLIEQHPMLEARPLLHHLQALNLAQSGPLHASEREKRHAVSLALARLDARLNFDRIS